MKKILKEKNLIIEKSEFTNLVVKAYEIGQGSPKIAILNGLHGLERTGAFLMGPVARELKIKKGLVSFIPFANPTSALKNTRLTPEDNLDLNRIFPGDKTGTLSFRLAAALFDYLKNFDLTIDVHTFPKMQMPIVAVFLANTPVGQKDELLKIIRILKPDFIWQLNTQSDEKNKAGSLIEALQKIGKFAFSLEVPDIELITQKQEQKVVAGLLKVINFLANRQEPLPAKSQIPVISRIPSLAPISGFFVPRVKVTQKVKRGQKIGEIVNLNEPSNRPVLSLANGPVIFILQKTFVLAGERVAIIGKMVEGQKI